MNDFIAKVADLVQARAVRMEEVAEALTTDAKRELQTLCEQRIANLQERLERLDEDEAGE